MHLAFTDKYSPIREMMQNAKRANATEIDITYTEETGRLTVKNNGEILNNFQDLLSVSSSGWGKEVQRAEKPYGLGFLSVLMSSASSVKVSSGSKSLTIDPKALLAGMDVGEPTEHPQDNLDPEDNIYIKGVEVSLKVKGLLEYKIKNLARHFPKEIDVFVNRLRVNRAAAEETIILPDFGVLELLTPFGNIIGLGNENRNVPVCFQGFKTNDVLNNCSEIEGLVIHLDQNKFDARLPDRAAIINYKDIEGPLRDAIIAAVLQKIENLPMAELLACYALLKGLKRLDIIEAVDFLAPEATLTVDDEELLEYDHLLSDEKRRGWGEDPVPLVNKTESRVFFVDSLRLSQDNFLMYLSAFKTGGAVCSYAGEDEPLSRSELGLPKGHEYTDLPTQLEAEEDFSVAVRVYEDKESEAAFIQYDGSDLYINACKGTEFDKGEMLTVLKQVWSYVEPSSYDFDHTAIAKDVEELTQEIQNYVNRRDGLIKPYEQILLDSIRRHLPNYAFPEELRGKELQIPRGE